MKILHVMSYFNESTSYQENHMLRRHHADGDLAWMVSSDRNFPHPDYERSSEGVLGGRMIGTGTFAMEGYTLIRLPVRFEARTRVWLKGLESTIDAIDPDVVICHSILDFSFLRIIHMRRPRFRLLVDVHQLSGQVDLSLPGRLFYRIFRLFFRRRTLARAEKIIAISEGVIPTLTGHLGLPEKRITLLPLAADAEFFRCRSSYRESFRKRHGIPETALIIISTGKMYEGKKSHLIPEALNGIDTREDMRIILAGTVTEDYRPQLEGAVNSSRYPCILLPWLSSEQLREAFCASDIAVWPGAATISTLEASACALPVICDEDLKERYRAGNGIGIPFGDRKALQAALQRLIDSPEERRAMGARGEAYIRNELNWKEHVRCFLKNPSSP